MIIQLASEKVFAVKFPCVTVVKDPALSQLWHRSQLCHRFDPWLGNFPHAMGTAKKKKKEKKKKNKRFYEDSEGSRDHATA